MSDGALRVALLHPSYWPEVRRGSERFIRDLADGLLAHGHHPELITSHRGPPSHTLEDGLTVTRNWRPPDARLRRRGHQTHLTHLPFSYASLRRGEFDLAHALYPTDGLVAARWSGITGRPFILSLMGLPDRASLVSTRGRAQTVRRAAAASAGVVVLSRAAARALERQLGIEASVIAPGVDLGAFTPGGVRAERPTLLFASDGRDPRKRLALLVESLAIVRRTLPQARLLVDRRGAGAALPDGMQALALDDREALCDAYRAAWLTVLPSVDEAFGLVLVESLACGTPVAGRADGAIAEIVDAPELGRLFEGDSPDALATACLEALELAGRAGTVEACRRRAEDFGVERCVDSYLALYRRVTGGS